MKRGIQYLIGGTLGGIAITFGAINRINFYTSPEYAQEIKRESQKEELNKKAIWLAGHLRREKNHYNFNGHEITVRKKNPRGYWDHCIELQIDESIKFQSEGWDNWPNHDAMNVSRVFRRDRHGEWQNMENPGQFQEQYSSLLLHIYEHETEEENENKKSAVNILRELSKIKTAEAEEQ